MLLRGEESIRIMKSFEIKFKNEKASTGETKFGGQPDWLNTPEWPISKTTGRQMRFICQINLQDIEIQDIEAKMAYLFMTDDEEYVDGTWEPDGGENAIVLQPLNNKSIKEVHSTGPTLYEMVDIGDKDKLESRDFECSVELIELTESEEEIDGLEIKNKLGGNPDFLQFEEYPSNEKWHLLIQLDSTSVPFYINFGDAGVGYGFVNEDGTIAKFLWQGA